VNSSPVVIGLIAMLMLAFLGGLQLARRKKQEEKQIRVIFFVFYFWLLAFFQLTLFSIFYFLNSKFNWL
jgi:hypothetical protein